MGHQERKLSLVQEKTRSNTKENATIKDKDNIVWLAYYDPTRF